MTDYLNEYRDELNTKVESLAEFFDEYDFDVNGCTKSDLEDINGLLKVVGRDKLPTFATFQKLIKPNLYSDDADPNEFDWDLAESKYEAILEDFTGYQQMMEQIEENLTGNQTVTGARIYTDAEIKDYLFNLFVEKSELYQIETPDGPHYLINAELESEIDNYVGFE